MAEYKKAMLFAVLMAKDKKRAGEEDTYTPLCVIALQGLWRTGTLTAIWALALGGIAGGLSYTIGGVIYGRKRLLINLPCFGFHEVFHIFVLGGTICHYLLMLLVLARM